MTKPGNYFSCTRVFCKQQSPISAFKESRKALVLLLAFLHVGCISPKSYVDPQFQGATLADIKPCDHPHPVVVDVSFQLNGTVTPEAEHYVDNWIMEVLRDTKVFASVSQNQQTNASHLKIVVNQIVDNGIAANGKVLGTVFTFGAAGNAIIDNYEMTTVYTSASGGPITKTYKHALYSTIGSHPGQPGLKPMAPAEAFNHILEDMLLNLVRDLQKEGLLRSLSTTPVNATSRRLWQSNSCKYRKEFQI